MQGLCVQRKLACVRTRPGHPCALRGQEAGPVKGPHGVCEHTLLTESRLLCLLLRECMQALVPTPQHTRTTSGGESWLGSC